VRLSFTKKIILGLGLGVLVGLFFGEFVAFLGVVGDVFIGLLQMTVLPYIMVSLVANLGRLSLGRGKRLIGTAALVLAGLLGIGVIPADMLELFIVSTVYTDRIRVVLGAVHLLALTVLTLAVVKGVFRVNRLTLMRGAALVSVLGVGSVFGLRAYLGFALTGTYSEDAALVQMHFMDATVPTREYRDSILPAPTRAPGRLAAIRQRHAVRVGYLVDALPFAFVNSQGQVVGFDIELAHRLAADLGVELELIRMSQGQIADYLAEGYVDIVMSGLVVTAGRAQTFSFPTSPMDLTLSFIVPDHRRGDFSSERALRRAGDLRIGIVQSDPAFASFIEASVPNAETVVIPSPRPFLRHQRDDLDAVLYSAEGGSAWTLIYPEFSVAVPFPLVVKLPVGYPTPKGDPGWTDFLSDWISLKQKDGTIDALFDHWILGEGAQDPKPRWSIVRDVLHWVE